MKTRPRWWVIFPDASSLAVHLPVPRAEKLNRPVGTWHHSQIVATHCVPPFTKNNDCSWSVEWLWQVQLSSEKKKKCLHRETMATILSWSYVGKNDCERECNGCCQRLQRKWWQPCVSVFHQFEKETAQRAWKQCLWFKSIFMLWHSFQFSGVLCRDTWKQRAHKDKATTVYVRTHTSVILCVLPPHWER